MDNTQDYAQKPKNWVWRSTETSITNRQISVCAVLEIPLAMALYGSLAYFSPWPWFSLLACLAAPLLLLRSEASIRLGKTMLWRYWRTKKLSENKRLLIYIIATLMFFLFIYIYNNKFLINIENSSFLITVLLYIVAGIVISAFMVACSITGSITGSEKHSDQGSNFEFSSFLYLPAFIFGIFVRATVIRITSTLRHLEKGLLNFVSNWHETVFVIDVWHSPSLLPKAEYVSENLNAAYWVSFTSYSIYDFVGKYLLLPFIYIPALLYRWNIKASFWLWGPIAYALRPVLWSNDETMRVHMSWRTTYFMLSLRLATIIGIVAWLLNPWLTSELNSAVPVLMRWLTQFLPEPGLNLRTGLLILSLFTWIWLLWNAYILRAAHDKPLGDADSFKKYDAILKDRFRDMAKPVRISGQWAAAVMFLTVWTYALAWALNRWPDPVQYYVWDWLKPWF